MIVSFDQAGQDSGHSQINLFRPGRKLNAAGGSHFDYPVAPDDDDLVAQKAVGFPVEQLSGLNHCRVLLFRRYAGPAERQCCKCNRRVPLHGTASQNFCFELEFPANSRERES
jgi:hypothetical protein